MIDLRILTVGEFQSQCYLLVGPVGKQAILIDQGDQPDDILHFVGTERAVFESFRTGPLPPDLYGDTTWY